jgi:hypothetical protein
MNASRITPSGRVSRFTFHADWLAFVVVVLMAAFFRFYALDSIPPGLHYDEAIDAHLAQDIRAGARPVYFAQGWGREPLYHYLVAIAMNWLSPALALRVTSAALGTVFVALAFLFLRTLFDWRIAAIGSAWLACSFWVMMVSRLGVRDVAVEPLAVGAMLALWQGAGRTLRAQDTWMMLGGVLLGLSLYTYQVSRALPLLVALWVVYLAIFQRKQLARQWKGLVVLGLVAALVAAPLMIYLTTHPGAESGRSFQAGPVQQLLQGQPGPMIEHALATLKMFTFYGDPQPLYNVPGRPALALLAGLTFYVGLIVALIRFRRSEYAFVLLWLVVALAPALVTYPAPHFPRTLLAQLPVGALIGIAVVALGDAVANRPDRFLKPVRSVLLPLLAMLVLGQTAWQTWNDYFVTWANLKEARFQYNAGPSTVARYLDASSDADPVVLAGLFVDDSDPYNFEMMLRRRDLDLRWFDASSALPVPSGAHAMRIVLYDFTPQDDMIQSRYVSAASKLAEEPDVFVVYRQNADALRNMIERPRGKVQGASKVSLTLPVSFGDVSLLGYDMLLGQVAPGGTLTLVTHWRVSNPGTSQPAAIFAHLVDSGSKLAAQDDRLGYPHHGWQPGDVFVQVHRITVPREIAPGKYQIKLGLYFRDTGARWPVAGGDAVFLDDQITVTGAQ